MKNTTLTTAPRFVPCDFITDAARFPTRADAFAASKLGNRCYAGRPVKLISGQYVLKTVGGFYLRLAAA